MLVLANRALGSKLCTHELQQCMPFLWVVTLLNFNTPIRLYHLLKAPLPNVFTDLRLISAARGL